MNFKKYIVSNNTHRVFITLCLLLGLCISLINIYVIEGVDTDSASSILFASGNWSSYYDMVNGKSPPSLTKTINAEWKQYLHYKGGNKIGNIWKDAAVDVHPPFFYILLNLFFMIFSSSFFAAKIFSVSIFLISSIIFYFLARTLFDRSYSIMALLLYCVTPASLVVTGEIRSNVILGLFNVIAILSVVKIIHEGMQWKWWIIWIIASMGAIYTHYIYAPVLIFVF